MEAPGVREGMENNDVTGSRDRVAFLRASRARLSPFAPFPLPRPSSSPTTILLSRHHPPSTTSTIPSAVEGSPPTRPRMHSQLARLFSQQAHDNDTPADAPRTRMRIAARVAMPGYAGWVTSRHAPSKSVASPCAPRAAAVEESHDVWATFFMHICAFNLR
jgi:hypothetical protein